MTLPFSAISLFSGCGGFDLGIQGGFEALGSKYPKTGIVVKWANDINKKAVASYRKNIGKHILDADILDLLSNTPSVIPSRANLVIGGFPCQPFSHAGSRNGLADPRGTLYEAMLRVIAKAQPEVFIAENVKGLLTLNKGQVLTKMIEEFQQPGYRVQTVLLDACKLGIPQTRQRLFIIGSREDLPKLQIPVFKPNTLMSATQAIHDLEMIDEGGTLNHFWSKAKRNKGQGNQAIHPDKPAPTIRAEHHGNIEFHYKLERRLSAREVARIQTFPDTFEFLPSTSEAYRQIGNAVPPVLAHKWGMHVAQYLKRLEIHPV